MNRLIKLFNKRIIATNELNKLYRSKYVIELELFPLGETSMEGYNQYKATTIDKKEHYIFVEYSQEDKNFLKYYK